MRNLKEETFYLASYFDSRMRGLDDNYQTSDATEAEDWAWEHLNQGGYVEIKNQKTGKEVYLDPDDLLDDYADYASGAFEDAINDSGVLEEDMGREIKRYSDVYSDERRNQGWWYFTTHGVQPGSVPKGVNILEVRDTPNGTYFRADAILNTSELEYYDIKERVPKEEESLKEDASMDSAQRLEDDGWVVLSHGVRGGDNNFYWLARRMNKERGKADWKAINDKTGEVIDITYAQALGEEPIGEPSGVSKLSRYLGKKLTEAPNDEKEQEKKPSEDNAEVDPDKGSGDAEKEQKIKQKYLEFIKQLKSAKDYNSYLQLLRKICQDDNSRKILFWGIQKGIDGNGQNAVKGQVKVTALLPTQNEIGVNDSLAYPLEKDPSGIPKLFKNPVQVGPNPIVVFNDGARNYVLDGHHRWSQVYMFNPNATMSAFILKKGFATGPVGALKNLQLIIGAGTGNVPSSDANGINIYTASEDQLKNWIAQRLKNSVGQRALEIFNKATSQQLDANGLLEYFMKNILTLKNTTGTWAKKMPPRSEMPQTNKGPDGVAGTIGYADNVVTESKKLREQESLNKKPANTKINIRESLNKYDLRTDNKYDLRNLYDACIMTDKEKRIIAEMIAKNTRANVLYEALMNKFEGKELEESNYAMPEKYITNELCNKTDKQSLKNAYDRNELSVIVKGGMWYTEGCPSRLFNTLKREMKKYYPYLDYLYDVTPPYKNESLKESKSLKEEYPPKNVTFTASEVQLDSDDEADDDEIISEILSDLLSDTYGYCHKGFNYEVTKNEFGEPSEFICTDIDWDLSESLKEDYDDDETYNRMRERIMPMVDALHEAEADMSNFYVTYSFGVDDNGFVTGGVDFEMHPDSEMSQEDVQNELETIFDENGFELDRRYKSNPGRTLFGRTHYQIIEKEK